MSTESLHVYASAIKESQNYYTLQPHRPVLGGCMMEEEGRTPAKGQAWAFQIMAPRHQHRWQNPFILPLFIVVLFLAPLFSAATAANEIPARCGCSAEYIAVCGSDFRTYQNPCVAACLLGKSGVWTPGSCSYINPFDKCNQDTFVDCPIDPCNLVDDSCPGPKSAATCEAVRCSVSTLPAGKPAAPCTAVWYHLDGSVSVCAPRVVGLLPSGCFCPAVYAPVCTTTKQTMGNACEAACHGYEVDYLGECASDGGDGSSSGDSGTKDCGCPGLWDPVCGSDGEVYANSCEAMCAGVTVAAPGLCGVQLPSVKPPSPIPSCASCPLEYAAVCATDGKTYPNRCAAECLGKVVRDIGKCYHCNGGECTVGKKSDLCMLASNKQCWSVKYECRVPPEGDLNNFLGKCLPKLSPTTGRRHRRQLAHFKGASNRV